MNLEKMMVLRVKNPEKTKTCKVVKYIKLKDKKYRRFFSKKISFLAHIPDNFLSEISVNKQVLVKSTRKITPHKSHIIVKVL